jgi:hypothetical protein
MTEKDVVAEGMPKGINIPHKWFKELWDSINAKRGYGWDVNPWVWVIEFEKIPEVR